MAGLKTYDPKAVIGTWEAPFQNVAVQEGVASGTFISITNEAPRWSKNTGSDGESTRVKSNNRNAAMAVTYRQGAPINALLNAISNEDDADNFQVGPFTLEDLNGSTLVLVEKAYLVGPADPSFADTEENREWTWDLIGVTYLGGGNDDA